MRSVNRLLLACGLGVLLLIAPAGGRGEPPAPKGDDKVQVAELTPRAEAAIDKGLRYLADSQNKDGSWGERHHVANTALALMAFMVKGYFPEKPPHGDTMARGVDFLLRHVQGGGGYAGRSMYEHGLATLALSEVWGMSGRSDEVRAGLKKMVEVIVRAQDRRRGGWRYQPRPTDSDVSVTVMQVVALASAKEAGILVPDETITRAVEYVKSCQNRNGGFGYRGASDPGFARTAAGVTSLLMCGEKDSKEVQAGLEYLLRAPAGKFERLPNGRWYYYGHYYAAIAMYQAGESYHRKWYPNIREALLKKQRTNGSWEGEDYGTPMAILTLGLPYRFLPIYQR